MEKRKVRFENIQDALLWLMSHRNLKEEDAKLYVDEYGNYVVHSPYRNIIEYYYYLGDYEDDEGNLISGDWDFDRMDYEEFIDKFDGIVLQNY